MTDVAYGAPARVNAPEQIEARLRVGRLQPRMVALMLPGRFVFGLLTFGLVALTAALLGSPRPLTAAAAWWMVSGTLSDVGCWLALLRFEMRAERSSMVCWTRQPERGFDQETLPRPSDWSGGRAAAG